jgi:hypothetical protein
MRRALIALLAVLVAALAVSGCGGSSKSNKVPTKAEYTQEFTPINAQIADLGKQVGAAVTGTSTKGKSNKDIAKIFNDLADQVRSVAKKLDGTKPPAIPTIQTQQAALVAGLNTSADDLAAIGEAAGKKDLKAAGTAAVKLTKASPNVGKPRVAIDKELGIKP